MPLQCWPLIVAQISMSNAAADSGALWTLSRLGLLAGGLALGVLAYYGLARFRRPRTPQHAPQSPHQLFHELCRAHKLSAAQERLLEWVASDRQLSLSGLVFLDPLLLERSISNCNHPGVRRRLTVLRTRLFAGLAGESAN
jgi:hypothetical protein